MITTDRRKVLSTAGGILAGIKMAFDAPRTANAAGAAVQDAVDIDEFLRTGRDAGGNMGVSSQAGKSKPLTGIVFRDGSDVLQNPRDGTVSAELLTGTKADPSLILVSFQSPTNWKLQTGPFFDVECRDEKSGDAAFLAVSKSTEGKTLSELSSSFFLERLFDPTGRFSFYGPPTDVKVKSSRVGVEGNSNYKYIDVDFSILSQSTNAEIPRKARIVATIPEGTDNAIMLVASANASRWRSKGVENLASKTTESFRAIPAPKSNFKLRPKIRGDQLIF